MTVTKATVTDHIDFMVERVFEGPKTLGLDDIRLRETKFLLNEFVDEIEDDIKNIEATGSDVDEGHTAVIEMDVNVWPDGVGIDNLVDKYNRDVQELWEEDDDLKYFDVTLFQTKELAVPMEEPSAIAFTKDGGNILFDDPGLDVTDELELVITLKAGFAAETFGATEWLVTITIIDTE